MQNLWHVCLRRLEQELPQQQYSTWVRPLAVDAGSAGEGTLVLSAPNRFILEHVRGTFLARIARIVSEEAGSEIDVRIVLARQTVWREAKEQGKRPADHLAHLVVHGTLHLLGHDHLRAREAARMEALEREVLARLGIADPYAGNGRAA